MRAFARWVLCVAVGALGWVAPVQAADASGDDIGTYPLDNVERMLPRDQPLPCQEFEQGTYRGDLLRCAKPVRVQPASRERLRALEQVVVDTAIAHYGRAPQKVLHLGTLTCRRIRLYP